MELSTMLTRAMIGSDEDHDPYECRDCGTSLDRNPGTCPVCGSDAVTDIPV